MNRTTTEMQQAATQAQAQLSAATAQVTAAQAGVAVAQLEANGAAQTLQVFDADTFTPQVWTAMGDFVDSIYNRYMEMALRAAKLMQQAYNFENDTTLSYIKSSYEGVVDGLLAADALDGGHPGLHRRPGDREPGQEAVREAVDLAGRPIRLPVRDPASQDRQHDLRDDPGRLRFGVSRDLRGAHPASRHKRAGHRPADGRLGNAQQQRHLGLPAAIGHRHPVVAEQSAHPERRDARAVRLRPPADGVLDSSTGNQTGIFEGAGVASSWTLSLPRAINDINYGTLTDVVLTFLYEARFDPQLVQTVLSDLASRPGYYDREMAIPLAWMYPDLFYSFVSSGTLTLNLAASDFPLNQTNPTVSAVSLLASLATGTSSTGITITLAAPGKSAVTGVTDATGAISSQGTASSWAGATGGSALGNWTITLPVASNAGVGAGRKAEPLSSRQPGARHRLLIPAPQLSGGEETAMTKASGTAAELLDLPSGGGSVSGQGGDFSVDLNTGTGAARFDFTLPAGPNGIQPPFSLQYSTGSGDGPFGIGWSLGLMTIRTRVTPSTAPPDPTATGTYSLVGVGDLVDMGANRFRPTVDTSGLLIELVNGSWSLTDKTDLRCTLGSTERDRRFRATHQRRGSSTAAPTAPATPSPTPGPPTAVGSYRKASPGALTSWCSSTRAGPTGCRRHLRHRPLPSTSAAAASNCTSPPKRRAWSAAGPFSMTTTADGDGRYWSRSGSRVTRPTARCWPPPIKRTPTRSRAHRPWFRSLAGPRR